MGRRLGKGYETGWNGAHQAGRKPVFARWNDCALPKRGRRCAARAK